MTEIAPKVHTLDGLLAGRAYLIEDSDGLTIIDTSIGSAGKKILKRVARLGYQPSDIKRILITHAHPDHVGGLPLIHAESGAKVYTSAHEKPVVQGEEAPVLPPKESLSGIGKYIQPKMGKLKGVPVDRVLEDGEILEEVLGGLQVIATPGHSSGHLSFWQPEQRILFCGDVIFRIGGITFNKMRLPVAMVSWNMEENIRSIQKLADLQPNIMLFGHGKPMTNNTAAQLSAFANKLS